MHALSCAIHETILKVCWVWFSLLLYVWAWRLRNLSPVWSFSLEALRFNGGWHLCTSSLAIVICCSFLLCSCPILIRWALNGKWWKMSCRLSYDILVILISVGFVDEFCLWSWSFRSFSKYVGFLYGLEGELISCLVHQWWWRAQG